MSQSMDEKQTCKGMRSLSSVYDTNVATHPSRFTLKLAKAVIELKGEDEGKPKFE